MKKKGFTLVELLAVIAILAILVIIALPNVLEMFREAKENTFVTEAQKILQTAKTQYVNDSINGSGVGVCYSSASAGHQLKLDGKSMNYYVKFSATGDVVHFQVYDESYQLEAGDAENVKAIKVDDLVSSKNAANGKTNSVQYASLTLAACPAE